MRQQHMEHSIHSTNLADILERVLDKGIVIAGDITISVVDAELLTIKVRLLIASVDKAMQMGINWWEGDPKLSTRAKQLEEENGALKVRLDRLEDEKNEVLRERLDRLEEYMAATSRKRRPVVAATAGAHGSD